MTLHDGTQSSCDIGCDVILHFATFFMLLSLVPISLVLWLTKGSEGHRSTYYLELAIGPMYIASLCLLAILFINIVPWGGHEKFWLFMPVGLCVAIIVTLYSLYRSQDRWENNYRTKKWLHYLRTSGWSRACEFKIVETVCGMNDRYRWLHCSNRGGRLMVA